MSTSTPAVSAPPKTALDHFDAVAADYDSSTGGCTREVAEKVISDLLPGINSDSVILDNASGTGIVIDVLLKQLSGGAVKPAIHGVDGAPKMVEIAASRVSGQDNVKTAVMPGESLDFAEETFTHSITNMGILFFSDATKGAREIYRTLKPGGVAVVTAWQDLGYPRVIRAVQGDIRPGDTPFELPLPKQWFDPEHTRTVLTESGFGDVKLESSVAHWAADSADDLADDLIKMSDGSKAIGIEMKSIIAVAYK
ncbi:uncharacterized protein DNG_04689 [Cephalotrichum gorgonifer]|uniref:Methyltransferase domain-containing protein n=1 Tax=Cephalotrichum gorgonifer TaxID=2041049 RepID=A0AAE8MWJ3_9PEZI|nr:uncharacterized protein DNG_04689 [Cephalotrichum gorgonifer]